MEEIFWEEVVEQLMRCWGHTSSGAVDMIRAEYSLSKSMTATKGLVGTIAARLVIVIIFCDVI